MYVTYDVRYRSALELCETEALMEQHGKRRLCVHAIGKQHAVSL
jgi:hypothetical protein